MPNYAQATILGHLGRDLVLASLFERQTRSPVGCQMTAPTIAHARKMQLEAAAEIEATGWDERGAVLGMADNFAEELLLEEEAEKQVTVMEIGSHLAAVTVTRRHYLHRRPPISRAFGLFSGHQLVGVCTFGVPASRHVQLSACPSEPQFVIELNRLWVSDEMPRNTESWFVSRCLSRLGPFIVISYADSAAGHYGGIYRALNFKFAGMTDEDRKTPRFDYVVNGGAKHSRDAFRTNEKWETMEKIRRKPKYKYWTVTGNRRDVRRLTAIVGWQSRVWIKEATNAKKKRD